MPAGRSSLIIGFQTNTIMTTEKDMKIKRKVTISMELDRETHRGHFRTYITENGKVKKLWYPDEAVTVALALNSLANDLLVRAQESIIAGCDAARKEDTK